MSDHNNSPRGVAEPAIDIGDSYVYPSPSRPGRLVLAMTVFPNAQPGAQFSDAAAYRFRIRPVTIPAGGSRFDVGTDEYDITCTFAAPVSSVQEGMCTLPNGATVSFRVGDEQGAEAPGARVFAGLRMDPLFNDSTAYVETLATRRLASRRTAPTGPMDGTSWASSSSSTSPRCSGGRRGRCSPSPRRRSRPAGSRCAWVRACLCEGPDARRVRSRHGEPRPRRA
jgi:hypothetical protein